MTSSTMEVNTGTLRSDLSSIHQEISALKREAEELRSKSERLSRMWEGEAKAEFMTQCKQELRALDTAIDALERFTTLTRTVGEEYERSERMAANVVNAIKV